MPSSLPAGCTQYDYQSQPRCSSAEKRTPENDYSLACCSNCSAVCNIDDLAWVAVFEFQACPACLSQSAAILAAEVADLRRLAVTDLAPELALALGIDWETGCTALEMAPPVPVWQPAIPATGPYNCEEGK